MTRKKREARDKRRELAGLTDKSVKKGDGASDIIEIEAMDAGSPGFLKGFKIPFVALKDSSFQFFKYWTFAAFCLLMFYMIQMVLSVGATNVVFGNDANPNIREQQLFTAAFFQIAQWLMFPLALFPWFSARTLIHSKNRVTAFSIMEPFVEKRQWLHLLGLGLVGVVLVGAGGAITSWAASQSFNIWVLAAFGVVYWLWVQTLIMTAAAGIWRENLPFWKTLWISLKGWKNFYLGWSGLLLGSLTSLLLVVLLVVTCLGIPLTVLFESPEMISPFVIIVFVPVIFLIMAFWMVLQASLALTLWDWSEKSEVESIDLE